MTKEIDALKGEIAELKGDILGLQRENKTINKRLDELAIYFENHGHVDQKITGQPVFLQDVYENKIKAAQQQQAPPPPQPVPEEPTEKKEE